MSGDVTRNTNLEEKFGTKKKNNIAGFSYSIMDEYKTTSIETGVT